MEIMRGLGALPLSDEPSVVTVGFFDGVHLGHRAVLARTVERARSSGLPAGAWTKTPAAGTRGGAPRGAPAPPRRRVTASMSRSASSGPTAAPSPASPSMAPSAATARVVPAP